jgi:hypothetical protein
MSLKLVGAGFVGLGGAIFVGGGGAPVRGFRKQSELLVEYREARKAGREPTLDQKGAYFTRACYAIGGACLAFGLVALLLAHILGGE